MRLLKQARRIGQSLFLVLLMTLAVRVHALPAYLATAKATYAFKSGGTIDQKSCNLCHTGSAPSANSLNLYGKDIQSALKASKDHQVTAALLHSLDEKDSDGDGWPNNQELANDTLPGDAASKPAGAPPAAAKPSASGTSSTETNPFDLKTVFFPSHAQHPVLVHFPIGLFVFSLFLDFFGLFRRDKALNAAAYLNLVGAAVTGLVSVITGLIAWRVAFGGMSLLDNRMLLYHLILGVVTTLLMFILLALRARGPRNEDRPLSNAYLVLGVLTFVLIGLTGHLGGIVSGVVR